MSGYDVAERILAGNREPPPLLVALTGFRAEADVVTSSAAGFIHHLVKPVNPERLVSMLREFGATRA